MIMLARGVFLPAFEAGTIHIYTGGKRTLRSGLRAEFQTDALRQASEGQGGYREDVQFYGLEAGI